MVFTHVVENIGMTIGVMPITGIPLPFFSYGGSFMLATSLGVGMALRAAREWLLRVQQQAVAVWPQVEPTQPGRLRVRGRLQAALIPARVSAQARQPWQQVPPHRRVPRTLDSRRRHRS